MSLRQMGSIRTAVTASATLASGTLQPDTNCSCTPGPPRVVPFSAGSRQSTPASAVILVQVAAADPERPAECPPVDCAVKVSVLWYNGMRPSSQMSPTSMTRAYLLQVPPLSDYEVHVCARKGCIHAFERLPDWREHQRACGGCASCNCPVCGEPRFRRSRRGGGAHPSGPCYFFPDAFELLHQDPEWLAAHQKPTTTPWTGTPHARQLDEALLARSTSLKTCSVWDVGGDGVELTPFSQHSVQVCRHVQCTAATPDSHSCSPLCCRKLARR